MKDSNYYVLRARARQIEIERRQGITKLAVTVIGIALIVMLLADMAKTERPYTETTVMVSAASGRGTLWDIAREYCPADMDIRKYIDYIESDNDCTALIRNGDVLTVRLYE